ncbi:MAG: restriction endonuclease subunit S [Paludibacteraceae bacterium]|nr:restriction endonuclease subunit S [Paludibacteraceae bacterium]
MKEKQHIPAGYKSSPLGIIPEDWEVKRLGEIAEITSGTTPSRENSSFYSNGTIPWVKTTDLNNNILNKTEELVTEKAVAQTSLKILSSGTVLVAMYGGFNQIGRTALLGVDATVNQALSAIVCKQEVFNHYVLAWLNCHVRGWKRLAASSRKDPNITGKDVERFPILVPKIEEQQRIVSVLSLWDTAISKQTALIEKLTIRKRGLMQQLLTGKKRLKGFEGEWKEVKLGDVFDERNETNRGDLPLLSITGDKGVIYQSESDKRDISNEDKTKYKRICPNDIGYNTMRMWQGRSALSELEGIVSPAYTIVTPKKTVDVRFMAMLIQQPRIVYVFWTHSQGLVSDTLNCKFPDFCQVKVTIPSKAEQTAIADFFVAIDKEIEIQKQKLTSLQEQKKGLMQVLLTGKKRVK